MTSSTFLVLEIWRLCAFSSIKNTWISHSPFFFGLKWWKFNKFAAKQHPGHDPFGTSHKAVCGWVTTKAEMERIHLVGKCKLSLGRYVVRELLTRYLPTWDKVPSLRGRQGMSPAFVTTSRLSRQLYRGEPTLRFSYLFSSLLLLLFLSALLWSACEICGDFLSRSPLISLKNLLKFPFWFFSSDQPLRSARTFPFFRELLPAPAAKPSAMNSFLSWRLLSGSPLISLRGMLDFLSSSFFFCPLLQNASWQHPLL